MAVPNTFASATSAIPLANLDANFAYYDAGFSLSGSAITFAGAITLTSGTANGVPYLNASKVLTSGAALTFNGTVLTSSFAGPVAATTLSASSTVSGTGFSTYLASPPAIGGTAAAAGTFTAIVGTSVTNSALTATRLVYSGTAGLEVDSANLTFNGTILTSTGFAGPLNGTVGATTPAAGAFTTLTTSSTVTLSGGTANGVAYLDGSKVLTTGSALVFDGSNLGLGVTPSAWPGQGVNYDVLQAGVSAFANVGDLQAEVSYNQYVESGTGTRNYITSNPALFYRIGNTAHSWFIAPSGTAGNAISFTQAMTLDASGNLIVGPVSASAKFTVDSGSGGELGYFNSTNANGGYVSFARSGTIQGDIGTAAQIVSGGATTDFGINARGSRNLILGTNNAERARITSDGNLLVGKTSSADSVVGSMIRGSGYITATFAESTDATTTYHLYSTGASAYRFYVGLGGTIFATSIVITAISDQRLKENVRDIDTGLDSIMALKPRRFDWKEGKGQDKKDVAGFIAQEFEDVFPECVSTSKAGEDGIEYKNINHETLIPTLVKAMQEQQAMIEDLKTRLAAAGI